MHKGYLGTVRTENVVAIRVAFSFNSDSSRLLQFCVNQRIGIALKRGRNSPATMF